MAEYTKIETARAIICDFCNQLYSDEPCEPADCDWLQMLDEDAADVAPVVHGRWIHSRYENCCDQFELVKCSQCSHEAYAMAFYVRDGNYCPNCGARMDGGADNAKAD